MGCRGPGKPPEGGRVSGAAESGRGRHLGSGTHDVLGEEARGTGDGETGIKGASSPGEEGRAPATRKCSGRSSPHE